MSTFVIVPGAWDTPATLEPVIEPLGSAGHDVIVVDLPCGSAGASLAEYADAVRAVVGADVVEIAADHGLFREQPARLAELLVAASG